MVQGNIVKSYDDVHYDCADNRIVTGILEQVDFNDGLSNPAPGRIEDLYVDDVFPPALRSQALHRGEEGSLTSCHFALKFGRAGDLRLAKLQSAYDLVTMFYARNQAFIQAEQGGASQQGLWCRR